MVIKRIGPLSCAKITGVLYALLGIVLGAFVSMAALAGGLASNRPGGIGFGALMGVGSIFVFPIFYGCIGFVGTLVGAWLYNIVAGQIGGIEVDLQ